MKSKIHRILINESETPEGLEVITRFKSFSEIRNGIFTTIRRLRLAHPGALIIKIRILFLQKRFYKEIQNASYTMKK